MEDVNAIQITHDLRSKCGTMRRALATIVVALWSLSALTNFGLAEEAQPPVAESVDVAGVDVAGVDVVGLVRKLDSNRYREREEATLALVESGNVALDPLLAAANGDRPEASDRAVWVLKKLGDSPDRDAALAALERLVQVRNRPTVVAEALAIQTRLRFAVCQENLAKLGGQLSVMDIPMTDVGMVSAVRLELGDNWRGTVDDLKCLVDLDQQHFFRLIGKKIDDDVIRLFETKNDLRYLQVFMSRVTPAAADALKAKQPKAVVYIRNRALLGIQGESQPNGVKVILADPRYGAASAGIQRDDVVTKIDGKPLQDFDRLTAIISQREPGDVVEVTVLRGEQTLTIKVPLSDSPPEL
jgi:hypothetical protein